MTPRAVRMYVSEKNARKKVERCTGKCSLCISIFLLGKLFGGGPRLHQREMSVIQTRKKRDPRHSISSGTDKETPPLISCSILNEENVMNSIRIYHDRKLKIPLDSRVKVNKWGLH